ncbi:MAG TPA: phenylalanine--tRNA ligase subunit beta, partial [Bacteroidales bacterium]|nr:phenylalanine--tRNA ligase subunit beta [Bacteroidales bacterium]
MKISYNWLKEYVDFNFSPYELAKILTDTGLEVEGIEPFESVKGGLKDVVIGKVITCTKHPNADKLSVTTVDIGENQPVQIVCGAPNVAEGQTVPVATVGATLYPINSPDGFQIKKAKIRGEASSGMICAEDELGLGNSHQGIMVLDNNAKIGSPAENYFNIEKDTVFEIGLTPNRIDGASHIGTARDIVAFLRHQGRKSQLKKPKIDTFQKDNNDLPIDVFVENTNACTRYSGITLTNLKIKESPDWLKNKLKAIGLSPINNVVDITNFVLHETGQPLHAFDANKIKNNKVVVKTLPGGTQFKTLDEQQRTLTENDLMICDAEKGMCIGGVFGGADSGVTQKTSSIFLESACFDPVYIRKTAKHHQLSTDASFRFERGTDPNNTVYALKRAALLMKEIAGATISSPITDIYPEPVKDHQIEVSFKNIYRLIGKEIDPDIIINILQALEITVEKRTSEKLNLLVPPFRVDVTREADIVEEILRIYGYNQVDFSDKINSTLSYVEKPDKEKVINTISDLLSDNGFLEIKSNSLTRETYFAENDATVVRIMNALSKDLSCMRQSLLPGGLETIIYNINRKRPNLKLYEFGNCYFINPDKKSDNPQKKYDEELHLGVFITGDYVLQDWTGKAEKSKYHHIKSIVSRIFHKMGVKTDALKSREIKNAHYDQALEYFNDWGTIAKIGLVRNELLNTFDIDQPVFAAELNWDYVLKLHKNHKVTFKQLPKFPEVNRDLSMILDSNVKYNQLHEIAFSTEKKNLKKMELFDVYEDDKIEKGKKS